jgi:hypothetical protein
VDHAGDIDRSGFELEKLGDRLETYGLNSVREALPNVVIEGACRGAGMEFRRRSIPPVVAVLHMIMAGLWPEQSFRAAWHVQWCYAKSLWGKGKDKSPSPGSVAKARARIAVEAWEEIFGWLCRQASVISRPVDSWRGHRLVVADGTTVTTADRPGLFEAFGQGAGRCGKYKYPLVRIVVTGLANTMTLVGCRIGGYKESEWSLFSGLLGGLSAGDVLIADRAYAGAHHYVAYMGRAIGFVTRIHHAIRVGKLKALWKAGRSGFVTRLKINDAYRRRDEGLPEWVTVRLIRVKLQVRGRWKETYLVTSLLDDPSYPEAEILELYSRRWRVETLLREVKVGMGADVLRSQTADGVRKEIYARLSAATIVRTLMVEAALKAGQDPLRLSFSFAVRAVVAYSPAFARLPVWALRDKYEEMLDEMASHTTPWRPNRNEPRAVRLERKHYPTLRTTRAIWRIENAA